MFSVNLAFMSCTSSVHEYTFLLNSYILQRIHDRSHGEFCSMGCMKMDWVHTCAHVDMSKVYGDMQPAALGIHTRMALGRMEEEVIP